MTLTLPIVVGKKYVRRDGETATVAAVTGGLYRLDTGEDGYAATGLRVKVYVKEYPADLVADYIEPAKGHPHAALMAEFAEDAKTHADPLSLWQWKDWDGVWRDWEDDVRIKSCAWAPDREYRRRPVPTPDPHAQNAAEYAKDMADTDTAWDRWEVLVDGQWKAIHAHPVWMASIQYRRRPL